MMADVESVAEPDERPPETVSAEGNLADHSNSASAPALQGTTDEESSPSDRIGNAAGSQRRHDSIAFA